MKYFKTLTLPANVIAEIAENQKHDPVTVSFDNGCQGILEVDETSGITMRVCRDDYEDDHELTRVSRDDFDVTGDFIADHGQDRYQLTVLRGARTSLSAADITQYVQTKGVRCPFCNSTDLHTTKAQNTDDGISQSVSCCECEAEWVDFYRLETISDHTPPRRNAICPD